MHTNTLEQNMKRLTVDIELKFKESTIAEGGVTAVFEFYNPYTLKGLKYDIVVILKEKGESNQMFVDRVKQFITNGSLVQCVQDKIQKTIDFNNIGKQKADDLNQIRHLWDTDTEFTVEFNIKE